MKRILIAAGGIIALLILVQIALGLYNLRPRSVRIELAGTPGLKVSGACWIDGMLNEVSYVLPATISCRASEVRCEFKPVEGAGKICGSFYSDGELRGTAEGSQCVEGELQHGFFGQGFMVSAR